MSEIKVNKISPKQTCTQLTLGDSGDTIIIPAGATITNSGTATGFGPTGAVSWDTTPKTTTVTAVSGVGYFVDTTSGAVTVNLPAGVAGDIVAISDYANTAATNKITIDPNGTDKINGVNQNAEITTNGASVTLLYIDSTRGWKDINDATLDVTGIPPFVAATGGCITTCGDYKIHTFTGPGTFTVTCAGTPGGSNSVEYMVVAGGGSGGRYTSGGGGAGGYRQNYPSPTTTGLPVTATAYPITVGAGGASVGPAGPAPSTNLNGNRGSDSVFSTVTSAGGGAGGGCFPGTPGFPSVGPGGSGGGAGRNGPAGGSGNTPPTSPSQGNNGGAAPGADTAGGGGGGAGGVGQNGVTGSPGPGSSRKGGDGGIGSPIATTFFGPTAPSYGTPGPAPGRYFAGGGAAGTYDTSPGTTNPGGSGGGGPSFSVGTSGSSLAGTAGTVNTGGGGGSCATSIGVSNSPGAGGSGIVVIRYKFQ